MSQNTLRTHSLQISIRLPLSGSHEPLLDPAQTAWSQLGDFDQWIKWIPGVDKVVRLNQGETGRGSRVRLQSGTLHEDWTIAYWEPWRHIAFIIHDAGSRVTYDCYIDAAEDNSQLNLTLELEFAFSGYRCLLSPPLIWMQKRKAVRWLESFKIHIQLLVN